VIFGNEFVHFSVNIFTELFSEEPTHNDPSKYTAEFAVFAMMMMTPEQ